MNLTHSESGSSVVLFHRRQLRAYLRRFTYDIIAHSKPVMELVIAQVGVDRIMLGSDYCFDVGYDQPVQFVEQLNLPANERRMILNGTAAKLLKI